MTDDKSHVNSALSNQSALQVANMGGYSFDSQFMKHMAGGNGMVHADMQMPMPRFPTSTNMMLKNEMASFESIASHPGLRVQLPSHESLLPPGNNKLDEHNKRQLLSLDQETGQFVKSQRRQSPTMQYPGSMNYNNNFSGNLMNLNMMNQHQRVQDVNVAPMLRFPVAGDAVGQGLPKLDMELGQMTAAMAMSQLAKQQMTQPPASLTNAPMLPKSAAERLAKYKERLRKKDEPTTPVRNQETTGGIIFDKGPYSQGGRWLVFWECRGRVWRKSFLVNMYGNDGARELAEQFWMNKMRAMQLFNSFRHASKDLEYKRSPDANRRSVNRKQPVQGTIMPITDMFSRKGQDFDRTPDSAPAKEDPEVFWEPETNSWCFEYLDRESQTLGYKRFPVDNMSKIEEVRAIASNERAAHWRDIIKEYSESEYCGHTYEKSRTCWRVSHWVPSKLINRNRYFNITKYGYIDAKEKSKLYRLLVYQLGGEEPDMPPPDMLPDPKFLELPLTKFYHRVLFSMRNKDKT